MAAAGTPESSRDGTCRGSSVPVGPGDWIDITRPLSPGTPAWPGDEPLSLEMKRFWMVSVSRLTMSCHLGTHLDAPFHLDPEAVDASATPLSRLIGPAEIIHLPTNGSRIGREILHDWQPCAPRLLIRTDCQPLDAPIGNSTAGLEPELIDHLADAGVQLIGIDSPSVDLFDDEKLIAHRALLARSMSWLEGLWLDQTRPGLYELIALPLALVGTDAAPVRAVARELG